MRRTVYIIVLACAAIWGCASPKSPTGGPEDEEGPRLVEVEPPNESTNFDGGHITFRFDEFIKSGSESGEVFISPPPPEPPEIWSLNKKIHVKMKGDLADSATYVLTLGSGIADHNAGNPLEAPIQYAFSPGATIDSAKIAGKVVDAFTGRPVEDFKILLFRPDSIAGKRYEAKKPLYAAQADAATGRFLLSYLRPGVYRIFGTDDKDRDFAWSQANEMVAAALNDTVSTADTSRVVTLRAFRPDTLAPKINKAAFLNARNLQVDFNEDVAFAVYNGDTLKQGPEDKPAALYLPLPQTYADTFEIKLEAITDTAGNARDSTLRLGPAENPDSVLKITPLTAPHSPFEQLYEFSDLLDSSAVARRVFLSDTLNDTIYRPQLTFDGYRMRITFAPAPEDSLPSPLTLTFDSLIVSSRGLPLGSRREFEWEIRYGEDLGSVQGALATASEPFVLQLLDGEGNVARETRRKTFYFQWLKEGLYSFRLIEDADNNGRWTPGQLTPWRAPETVYTFREKLEIRPGWTIEEFPLAYPETKMRTNGQDGEAPEAEEPPDEAEGEGSDD